MSETAEKLVPEDEEELRGLQKPAEASWKEIASLPPSEIQAAADAWAAEYGHLFYWCCGSPVFGGPVAERYYEAARYVRGDLRGSRVYYV